MTSWPTRLAATLLLCCAAPLIAQDTVPQAPEAAQAAPGPFEFKADDTVVLLGSTVMEREQRYGFFESYLRLALADKNVAVRNLGWSGDTVFGHARSYFGPPEEGLQRLSGHLEMLKPDVVILCYGTEMAHERLGGMPAFLSGYRALLDLIREKSPGVRLVIATPPPMETLPPPMPDQADANKNLSSLRDALAKFARSQSVYYVDWFEAMGGLSKPGRTQKPLTENGVHYTQEGYQKLSAELLKGLGLKLPDVPPTAIEPLRKAVVAKDFLFFNRWRPQNETYLFGFRKHEQGQNAKEIPMFDPLIAEADKKIAELKTAALAAAKRP
jgi:lysophospholipase L1-like esterase